MSMSGSQNGGAPDQPETFDLTTLDIAEEKRQELLRLFPEVRTEGGKLDFERLKLALGEAVDVGRERYGMHWPGKADCFKTIQQPSQATLRPCVEESVEFENTENLIIEGDNLEVLKLLQKSYLGKVKMIYIDPPYNTGNDFIYPDNYSESLQTYLEYTCQIDSDGKKFGTNTDVEGRFHSKWLNMMSPRLYLAKNLLRQDGAIFISLDDRELDNLKKVCDEIFGEENFIGRIVWKNATDNNPTNIAIEHEYIVVYAKSKDCLEPVWKSSVSEIKSVIVRKGKELLSQYRADDELQAAYAEWFRSNKDQLWPLDGYKHIDRKGVYAGIRGVHNPGKEGYRYDVIHPETGKPCTEPLMGYRFPQETLDKLLQEGKIIFGEDHNKIIELKSYAEDYQEKLSSVIELDGRSGAYDLRKLFPDHKKLFDNPKPVKFLCSFFPLILKDSSDIILDFFAGSASTAHAVFELNSKDSSNRRFILVQLPESTGRTNYPTIADITKERVRRVIKKLNDDDAAKQPSLLEDVSPKQDRGFRVFKLAESNFKPWNADVPHDAQTLQAQLFDHVNHIRSGRTQDDILYELLLKSGFPLTTPVETLTMEGKTVFSVAGGALLICLERSLTMELIRAMAATQPERVVCLDEGFAGNDQLKANAVQIFKTKGVTKFQTV